MIPAWTVSIAVFAALLMKYYGLDLFDVVRHRRAKKRITEKEWMLVFRFLGLHMNVEPFKLLTNEKRSLGYIIFIFPALIFLLVSFLTSYLYALLFSFLSGVFFFILIRMLLGPRRVWKLTVRHDHYDVDRYLIPWNLLERELRDAR